MGWSRFEYGYEFAKKIRFRNPQCLFSQKLPQYHKGFRGLLIPWKPFPRFHWDRRICLLGLIETTESASVVSLRLLNLPKLNFFIRSFVLKTTFLRKNYVVEVFFRIPRSHWNHGSHFRQICSASLVSLKPFNPLPQSQWNQRRRPFKTNISNCLANLKPCAKRLYPVNQCPSLDWLMEKTECRKSRDTVLLMIFFISVWTLDWPVD
jgi:hypothetical protein